MSITPAALRRSLERRSLARFSQAMMPAFELSPVHKLIFQYLERLLSGDIRKLWISTPPRHGKSTTGSIMLPSFALGRNPKETIIQVSYGSDLAEGFGRRVRNIIASQEFRELFPACQLSPDSQAAYRFETTEGGEYSAVGRGGPVTGRGASLLILDDLIKDAGEANSETTCRSIIEWLRSVGFTRLSPGGRILSIATRWSEGDPQGWLAAQAGWTILHLPALAEANDALGRNPGEALWPSRYPVDVLEKIRADIGPRAFACLFQGNVSSAQGTIFKRDWFRHYTTPPEKFKRIVQSWDTSFKTGKQNDPSVCVTIGEAESGFYLLHLWRNKVEFPELKRQVALQADQWKPSEIYIEDAASGQSLIQELKLSTSVPVIAIRVDRDKETRAAAVTGYFEAGRVFFPEGAPWISDLEDELASFPGGLHDDQVDALTQALNRMRDSGGALGMIELLKGLASGTRKLKEFLTPPVNSPAEIADQWAAPTSCSTCGCTVFDEIIGSEPPLYRCSNGGHYVPGLTTSGTMIPISNGPGPCGTCGSHATVWMSGGMPTRPRVVHCNMCSADDGVIPEPVAQRAAATPGRSDATQEYRFRRF